MNAKWIFLDDLGRPRSGWRFLIFIVLFVTAAMAIGSVGLKLLYLIYSPFEPLLEAYFLTNGLVTLIPTLLIGWLCGKYLDRVPFRALGAWFTRGWLTHLIAGSVFGVGTLLLAVIIAFALGGLRFVSSAVDVETLARSLGISFAIFAVGAAFEEALFRGYILQTFARSGLAALAIAMTSIFFGAVHAANPNATALSIINTMLAGVWFGIAYLKTRDLWFVWGMHLMWNWIQGAFFGIEVSGITNLVSAPLLREIDAGPVWLTGESYGIEGGVVTTIAIVVSTAVIYFLPWVKADVEMVRLNSDTSRSEI